MNLTNKLLLVFGISIFLVGGVAGFFVGKSIYEPDTRIVADSLPTTIIMPGVHDTVVARDTIVRYIIQRPPGDMEDRPPKDTTILVEDTSKFMRRDYVDSLTVATDSAVTLRIPFTSHLFVRYGLTSGRFHVEQLFDTTRFMLPVQRVYVTNTVRSAYWLWISPKLGTSDGLPAGGVEFGIKNLSVLRTWKADVKLVPSFTGVSYTVGW